MFPSKNLVLNSLYITVMCLIKYISFNIKNGYIDNDNDNE